MTETVYPPASPRPVLREVSFDDIREVLQAGWADFRAAPRFGLFFGGVYAISGLIIYFLLRAFGEPWMIIPIAVAFPLVGPFVAAGCYEVSRRLQTGETLDWRYILRFMFHQHRREFSWMAFIVLFIFWIWMYQIRLLIAVFMDWKDFDSVGSFLTAIFTTGHGFGFITVGTLVGALLAFVLYATTVISMPLLIEREHDMVTAIATSWRAVLSNRGPMIGWGIVVTAITLLAMLPLFLGLLVALPVLGHATWHLYKKVVAPLE